MGDRVTATWGEFRQDAPELAQAVEAALGRYKHHVLATLRRDGSPRVSGTEVQLRGDDLTVGMMPGSMKALDLQHDGRFALHANPGDGSLEGGDAKLAGVAVEVTDEAELARFSDEVEHPPGPFHLFRLEVADVTLTTIHPAGDRLLIRTWRPGQGETAVERL